MSIRFVGLGKDGILYESWGQVSARSAYYACRGDRLAYIINDNVAYRLCCGNIERVIGQTMTFSQAKFRCFSLLRKS